MQDWTPCNDWELLPDGEWLVKTSDAHTPYHVANVRTNPSSKVVIVGGHFHFDMGGLVAYSPFGRYE